MNLEDILRSEISQALKDKYCMILLHEVTRIGKFLQTEGRTMVTGGEGEEE